MLYLHAQNFDIPSSYSFLTVARHDASLPLMKRQAKFCRYLVLCLLYISTTNPYEGHLIWYLIVIWMILLNTLMIAEFCDNTPKNLCKNTAARLGCFVNCFLVELHFNFWDHSADSIVCEAHWLLKRTIGWFSSGNCNGGGIPKVLCKNTAACLGCCVNCFLVESPFNFWDNSADSIVCQAHWILKRMIGWLSSGNCDGRGILIWMLSLNLFVRAPPFIFSQVVLSAVMWNYSF